MLLDDESVVEQVRPDVLLDPALVQELLDDAVDGGGLFGVLGELEHLLDQVAVLFGDEDQQAH